MQAEIHGCPGVHGARIAMEWNEALLANTTESKVLNGFRKRLTNAHSITIWRMQDPSCSKFEQMESNLPDFRAKGGNSR
ncbi:MAG: hypothetical protein MUC79_12785, partial [Thiobacillaceae bacterium]|nr:hypothetical protein [Thiobacillaceae bacterium]